MARRFRFPLETLLRLRAERERAAQRQVAEVLAAIARREQQNSRMRDEIRARQNVLLQTQAGPALTPADLAAGRAWVATLRGRIAAGQQEIAQRQAELARRQQALIAARRDRRVIEKLRERRRTAHEHDARKREQALGDEVALQMLALRRANEEAG